MVYAKGVDVLVGTLGKAFGVNGGYVTSNQTVVTYLRETAPMYIYSNPISPAEASAALKSLEILNSEKGGNILAHLHRMTKKFEKGLLDLGYEIIESDHPVVPKGDEEIRFQINADHTPYDIDYALAVLKGYKEKV
jgi:glycine C-acetyltransferase